MRKNYALSLMRLFLLIPCLNTLANAEPIPVRYAQGSSHGFLTLKTLEGVCVATGEMTQTVHGSRVTSRLIFHFRDGSVDDDLTVFTQHRIFRLISNHHIQRGPFFSKAMDLNIDATTGQITSRGADGKLLLEHLNMPDDVSNGLPPNLILNILPSVPETTISYVAPGAKPRLIRLRIKPTGTLPFTIGGLRRKATDFNIHIEFGGIAGAVAPVIGKEPRDYHIWLQNGTPPAFIREEGQIYEGGPVLRMEVVSPTFSR